MRTLQHMLQHALQHRVLQHAIQHVLQHALQRILQHALQPVTLNANTAIQASRLYCTNTSTAIRLRAGSNRDVTSPSVTDTDDGVGAYWFSDTHTDTGHDDETDTDDGPGAATN